MSSWRWKASCAPASAAAPSSPNRRQGSKARCRAAPRRATRRALLSRRGGQLIELAGAGRQQWGAFTPGVPEVRQFPAQVWSRLQSRLWRKATPTLLSYATGAGDAGLRHAIAQHLRTARDVDCTPEQVVLTSGTQQSLRLVSQLLCDPGDAVWLEEPGYWGARSVFRAAGLKLVPVRVDDEGMAPDEAQLRTAPRAMFVTPVAPVPDRRADEPRPAPPVAGLCRRARRVGDRGRLRQRVPLWLAPAAGAAEPGCDAARHLPGYLLQDACSHRCASPTWCCRPTWWRPSRGR